MPHTHTSIQWLVLDCTRPLPESVLTSHKSNSATFTSSDFTASGKATFRFYTWVIHILGVIMIRIDSQGCICEFVKCICSKFGSVPAVLNSHQPYCCSGQSSLDSILWHLYHTPQSAPIITPRSIAIYKEMQVRISAEIWPLIYIERSLACYKDNCYHNEYISPT